MAIKIAINGFGRIGRPTFKRIVTRHPDLEVAAINDLTDTKTLAHLLKYDSVFGNFHQKEVGFGENSLTIDGKEVLVFGEKNPEQLPWRKLGIDIVLECTGNFTDLEGAGRHKKAGSKKVIISAPAKDSEIPSFVLGVNAEKFDPAKDDIIDMGSCTTNALAVAAKVLQDKFGIERGFMNTVHSYTNDQRLLDLPHKDLRRARAAAINIIPTTTGAAKAIGKVIPELEGILDGFALRVATATLSILDLTVKIAGQSNVQEVNDEFRKASETKELKGILAVSDEPLVSSDYIGSSYSAVLDSAMTMVKDDLVKIIVWYDNEWAYACRLGEFAEFVGKKL